MAEKAKQKRQAVRKKQPSQESERKLGRYVLLLLIVLPVIIYVKPLQYVKGLNIELPTISINDEVKITNIKIDGEFRFSSREALQRDISAVLADDFVRLDIALMREKLEAKPWYKSVRLARQWPSTLKVDIEEEQPIARWGSKGFINRYGEVVLLDDVSALSSLPLLSGSDNEAYDIARRYLLMSQVLNEAGLYISALRVDMQGAQKIEFSSGFYLMLGERQLSERLEKFLYLYKQLASRKQQLAYIDMRYESGVAVQWRDGADSEIASR